MAFQQAIEGGFRHYLADLLLQGGADGTSFCDVALLGHNYARQAAPELFASAQGTTATQPHHAF
jgi:hypothetical protein